MAFERLSFYRPILSLESFSASKLRKSFNETLLFDEAIADFRSVNYSFTGENHLTGCFKPEA